MTSLLLFEDLDPLFCLSVTQRGSVQARLSTRGSRPPATTEIVIRSLPLRTQVLRSYPDRICNHLLVIPFIPHSVLKGDRGKSVDLPCFLFYSFRYSFKSFPVHSLLKEGYRRTMMQKGNCGWLFTAHDSCKG